MLLSSFPGSCQSQRRCGGSGGPPLAKADSDQAAPCCCSGLHRMPALGFPKSRGNTEPLGALLPGLQEGKGERGKGCGEQVQKLIVAPESPLCHPSSWHRPPEPTPVMHKGMPATHSS